MDTSVYTGIKIQTFFFYREQCGMRLWITKWGSRQLSWVWYKTQQSVYLNCFKFYTIQNTLSKCIILWSQKLTICMIFLNYATVVSLLFFPFIETPPTDQETWPNKAKCNKFIHIKMYLKHNGRVGFKIITLMPLKFSS